MQRPRVKSRQTNSNWVYMVTSLTFCLSGLSFGVRFLWLLKGRELRALADQANAVEIVAPKWFLVHSIGGNVFKFMDFIGSFTWSFVWESEPGNVIGKSEIWSNQVRPMSTLVPIYPTSAKRERSYEHYSNKRSRKNKQKFILTLWVRVQISFFPVPYLRQELLQPLGGIDPDQIRNWRHLVDFWQSYGGPGK